MSTGRLLALPLVLLLLLASLFTFDHAMRSLHAGAPTAPATPVRTASPVRRRPPAPAAAPPLPTVRLVAPSTRSHNHSDTVLIATGVELASVVMLGAAVAVRLRSGQRQRPYGLFELHLSTHDQAKPRDLEDAVEAIANTLRAWPSQRLRQGQPYVAFELICEHSETGQAHERAVDRAWSLNIRCEPATAAAIDAALRSAYPDVRLGHTHAGEPDSRPGVLLEPPALLRLRKARSFVYPLIAGDEERGSPPIEQVALAQLAAAGPSIVRLQLTPTPAAFEQLARLAYHQHEHQSGPAGSTAGSISSLDRSELLGAQRTQHRGLFWLEASVAADTAITCKNVAGALAARRGENRLTRRRMWLRRDLYRRRFPLGLRPVIPSTRSLISTAEVAHLLELPSAGMKGVPVTRSTIPRIPAPPNALRAGDPTEPGEAGSARQAGSPHRALGYPVLPILRADNAQVLIHPDDRKYGSLLVGSMGSGKTSAMLRMYLNDIRDPAAAPIVIDPKSELARLCLEQTPPDCGKRVWYLDLGEPAFGMSPLRIPGERPLAIEAAQTAENIVASLLDINEGQIYQSSRRYLYHAVIGALAYATRQGRRPKLDDVYTLLRPKKDDFRQAVAEACADQPDLDQTAEFFLSELPDDLSMAGSSVAQRLDAPRNKISGLTGVPPLRRFFDHPTDIPLREIVQARDVLIVDANMAAIGSENSKACMHFVMRMLHTQLQRQVHQPEAQRPRVPLIVDEAHYVADSENVVDQIATHRAAGLEVTFGLQFFAQLGAGAAAGEKIRSGVINLLQDRFLFRLGDAKDAEDATRIAMAVYSTMIRDDPDSRARLRVTPEQVLQFPVHFCLASWIAAGARIPSFIGETYALPARDPRWARHHLERMKRQVEPEPEPPTSEDTPPPSNSPARARAAAGRRRPGAPRAPAPVAVNKHERDTAQLSLTEELASTEQPAKREVRVDIEPAAAATTPAASAVRRIVGRPAPVPESSQDREPAPDSLRELAYLDRINHIGESEQHDTNAALPRLYDADYTILALLDRVGLVPRVLIGRAALPGRADNTVSDRLTKLYRHGLIARHPTGLRQHTRTDGKPPYLYALTRRGMQVAQERKPSPAISPKREWRAGEQRTAARVPHDLHALAWNIQLHHLIGALATDNWRTPRYATGRYPVPQAGNGQRRHPLTVAEIPVPDGQAIIDLELKEFSEVKPDLSQEIRIDSLKLSFDLLLELDLTARGSYNHEKFLAYDAFLTGWALAHPRYRTQGTRPIVLFICPSAQAALACAKVADAAMTGRIGAMSTPAEHWQYAGREHILFATEQSIHRRQLTALALPPQPPTLREQLTGTAELTLTHVELLPPTVVAAARGARSG